MMLLSSLSERPRNPLIIFSVILAVYLPVQAALILFMGDDTTLSLAVAPVLFSGWYLGPLWAGASGCIIIIWFCIFRFFTFSSESLLDISIGTLSIFTFTLIGIAIGRVEELNRLLKQELLARKIAEQQLSRSNKELEQFAYIASHDLQEPLRKIAAFGSTLTSKYKDVLGDQGTDYLTRIQNAAQRMQSLIDGLLAYSRVTTTAQPFSPANLSVIVQEVLGDLETKIKDTGAIVRCYVSAVIEADPIQMRQLFQNLIGNALKYHVSGVTPEVTVRAAVAADRCTITVHDNGIGFEQQYAERIFGVFVRLHGRSSGYEGSGIGLSVCRKIVERHGGAITAQSEPGKGATFTAAFPIKQELQPL
jgi:light-regulated signal transduction histidine kinase (bacteriophytochrome)